MIFFDVTNAKSAAHRSGLTRVSEKLRSAWADRQVVPVRWKGGWVNAENSNKIEPLPSDWLVTAELFCEAERLGFRNFLERPPCRLAAIFHDAIPLKFPHITWPQSVSRHPEYMKMLGAFDLVLPVSEASRRELLGFWDWQGGKTRAQVRSIHLGADFLEGVRPVDDAGLARRPPNFLSVGIIEPRKNQEFLLKVCEGLWREGLTFSLQLIGRVNPHFGKPILARMDHLNARYQSVHYHASASDQQLREMLAQTRATVFPTMAEGCGLPVLESLWAGRPCICSDLPVLQENASIGGCLAVPVNDAQAWSGALRRAIADDDWIGILSEEAAARILPTWADCGRQIAGILSEA